MTVFSYNLKSATDRWPLVLLFEIIFYLFDRSFASAAVNSALATNIFQVPFVKNKWSSVSFFIAGQPLGYYSSWALFALSHHFVVWWCAEQVYSGQLFTKYAVLGDYVIIADKAVAEVFSSTLPGLGVNLSTQKSFISDSGAGEFFKRFRVLGMSVDLSLVSIKAVKNFYNPYGLMAVDGKYSIKRFSTLCRVGGMGYKGLSRIDHVRSKHYDRVWHMRTKFVYQDIEWWLGRGRPLNPYLRGLMIDHLRPVMKPKDLRLAPPEL